MAAPDQSPSRPGQVNAAGDAVALFLKVFAGEVLAAFRETYVMAPRTVVRQIKSGKSCSFPATWKATAAYHTPGAYLLGQSISSNERVITIDDLLTSTAFIASIDEAMSHFDFRSEYSYQLGAALARAMDKNLLQVALLAARASATITGGNGGSVITNATALTNADSLIASIFDAVQALDEKDVPESDRFVALKPDQYYLLVNSSSKAVNRDYTSGANGGVDSGLIMRVAGAQIVKTNFLPQSNINSGPTAYQGNFSTTAALVWNRACVGTVKLMDLAVESDYLVTNQGTIVVAKMAVGHGILRPEAAVEIKTS